MPGWLVYASETVTPPHVPLNLAANVWQSPMVWSYALTVAIVMAKVKFLI